MRLPKTLWWALLASLVGCGLPDDGGDAAVQASDLRARLDAPWPEARAYGSMVYDPIHRKVLVLSGQDASGLTVPSVWAFDVVGRTWTRVADWAPQAIDLAAFDVASGKVIVYYGFDWATFQPVHGTWALDPETGEWEDRMPATHPEAGLCGCGSQMTYDLRARKVVMFGGVKVPEYIDCLSGLCDEAGWAAIETNDVWTYDYPSNAWTKMPRPADQARLPSPRNSHGLSYDLLTGKVLLFGGDNCLESFGDTWAYDLRRNTWKDLAPAEAPSARSYPKLTYDWLASRTVAFGGEAITPGDVLGDVVETVLPAETWTYHAPSNTWAQASPERSPSARAWNDVAYSLHGNRVVMFGGGQARDILVDDTWLYQTRAERWTLVPKPGQK